MRYRGLVLVTWLAAGALLLPASGGVARSLDVTIQVPGSESAAVEDALRTRFASPFGTRIALVVTGTPSPATPDGRQLLRSLIDSLARVPGVTRTLSYLDRPDTTLVGHDGGTLIIVGLETGPRPAEALMPPLRRATMGLQQALRGQYPNLTMHWTGFAAINYDLQRTSSADAGAAEARALPLTLALLLWGFGALGAALLSVFAGMSAIGLTLGLTVLLTRFGHPSILLLNVVTMIGLGLGIDYALLIISRFREAIAAGKDRAAAAADAALHGGHTIAISGLTVMTGFGALLGITVTDLRSVALGGLLVTLVSMLLAMTLLPVLLSWIGPGIEVGRVRRRGDAEPSPRWLAWAGYVTRHPWPVLVVAGLPVIALALQTVRLRTDVETSDWLPPGMESTQGLQDLRAMGRSALVGSMPVIVDLPAGTQPYSKAAWNAVLHLGEWITANPGIARVESLPAFAGIQWSPATPLLIPGNARRTFVSRDRQAVTLEVIPKEHADRDDLTRLVGRLRAADPVTLTGLHGARIRVGGLAAFRIDYGAAVRSRLGRVITLAITGTLLVLFVGFRSVLVPIKAVALNLMSVTAALGVVVIVFQDGHGVRWLGLDHPPGGVFSSVPVLVFCVVFGLSMDYEVFLVARVREARTRGCDEGAALVEGLGRTAQVITNAAAIMIVVFAAFALGQIVVVKMLGVALAAAVALDATVVRLAIGPALLGLAGRWNWWPGTTNPHVHRLQVGARQDG